MTTTLGAAATTSDDLTLEQLRAGDTGTVHAVFDQLSAHSVWLRFHTGMPRLTPRMAERLAAVRPGMHEVLVARLGGVPVGLARWHRDPGDPRRADVAVEVADAVQGRGVGRRLLGALAESARAAGIRELSAEVLGDNVRVVRWLGRLGAVTTPGPDPTFLLHLEPEGASVPCGSMGPCWSGYSDPSGSRSTPGTGFRGGRVRATSSPASSPAGAVRSRPRPSSTSCGPRRPAA